MKRRAIGKSQITGIKTYDGESIEDKVRRILDNKEPISDGAPIIFTERKDGVLPAYDIRTDRFELAIDAMDKIHSSHVAKREARIVDMNKKTDEPKGDVTGG